MHCRLNSASYRDSLWSFPFFPFLPGAPRRAAIFEEVAYADT